jgi:hypothetical protein
MIAFFDDHREAYGVDPVCKVLPIAPDLPCAYRPADRCEQALEQALHDRRPAHRGGLVHHSDRGSQGGINRSSQHLEDEVAMNRRKAAIGSVWANAIAFDGSTTSGGGRRAEKVLGRDCGRPVE